MTQDNLNVNDENGNHLGNRITKFPSNYVSLNTFQLQELARELLPNERVSWCMRWLSVGKSSVDIWRDDQHGKAHYCNLRVCSSVWHCPICAQKITERRKNELINALITAYQLGLQFVHVTLTMRHKRTDKLPVLLKSIKNAFSGFVSGRQYQALKEKWSVAGFVRALEVTHSEKNGWHCHLHVLFLVPYAGNNFQITDFENDLKSRWLAMLAKQNFDASWQHGVKATISVKSIAEYIAKWGTNPRSMSKGIEVELTKNPTKRGHIEGNTPFQLLGIYEQGTLEGGRAGKLFQEYASAFKGSHQLQWSTGLKSLLLIEQVSDEELANREESEASIFYSLSTAQWRIILEKHLRSDLLKIADHGIESEIVEFLKNIGAWEENIEYERS